MTRRPSTHTRPEHDSIVEERSCWQPILPPRAVQPRLIKRLGAGVMGRHFLPLKFCCLLGLGRGGSVLEFLGTARKLGGVLSALGSRLLFQRDAEFAAPVTACRRERQHLTHIQQDVSRGSAW